MKKLNYAWFMNLNPTLYMEQVNQLGQNVKYYEHPLKGDEAPVMVCINETVIYTDFYDCGDFYEDSEYNYCMGSNGEIKCFFEVII